MKRKLGVFCFAGVVLLILFLCLPGYCVNPLEVLLEDFEDGSAGGGIAVTTTNSSAGGNSNSTLANVSEGGSKRLQIKDTDGGFNGAVMTLTGAIPAEGFYLITTDIKVDNATAAIGCFGLAVKEGATATSVISDTSAGYVMNLSGTGDGAKEYQTIGVALRSEGGTYPKDLTIYFSTNPSGNTYNGLATDGTFQLSHRLSDGGWAASSSSAVYIDNIKMYGPGGFGEERHFWISIGDGFTVQETLDQMIDTAFQNNFNCIDIIVRYRGGDGIYFLPNRTNSAYPNPETSLIGAENDPLQRCIDRGHALGMKIFASFSCFAVTETIVYPTFMPTGTIMYVKKNSKYVPMTNTSSSADGALWADVSIAAVRTYTINVAMDLVANYDIDGIIFDRVRYPDYNYSYNPIALSEMGFGTTKPAPTDPTFKAKRQGAVTMFIAGFYEQATTLKPWLIVGAVPIAYGYNLSETYNTVFQSWIKWNSQTTANRVTTFGVCDNIQPQFYRLCTSGAPASNATLMEYARFGDQVHTGYAPDYGLMPGAFTICSPLFFHPTEGDTCQSEANSQNIVDSRNQDMNGWGLYQAAQVTVDLPLIRATTANNEGVDVLANPAEQPDYFFKKGYDNIEPNPAQNFAANPQTDGSCILTWNAPSPALDGETAVKYHVYKSTDNPVPPYRSNLITLSDVTGLTITSPRSFAGDYYFKIIAVDDYNNISASVQIGPVALEGDGPPPPPIIVDNPQAVFVGTWTIASDSTDKYGTDYRYAKAGTGSRTATFSSGPITRTGIWVVKEWHPAGTNRGQDVKHIVTNDGETVTYLVNQQVAGGAFNSLGEVHLTEGQSYTLMINDNFINGGSKNLPWVCMADAICWEYVRP
jgi:uncharacterized lipoprotein YddW (UPF0748 family)